MKRFPLLLFMIIVCSFTPKDNLLSNSNIEETLLKAKQEDKHIFLRFTASWCLPCQMLNDQISLHPEIEKELNEIYLELEMDYENPNDQPWFEKYDILCLPTMLVINEEGDVIERLDGTVSIVEMNAFIKRNAKYPIDDLATKELSSVNLESEETNILYHTSDSNSQKLFSLGFTIQFGAFSKYVNAQNLAESLKSDEGISTIIIEESTNNKTFFKVRQASFSENKSGRQYVKAYKNKGIDCLLKRT